jgi:hypothetical protein
VQATVKSIKDVDVLLQIAWMQVRAALTLRGTMPGMVGW